MSTRRILHVDMDAFFASIEQRDDPQLRGHPVAVGGRPPRGVVAAASYEARAFGIHSAMPSADALRRCPQLVFRPSRMDHYRQEARRIRDIFLRYTSLVEPLSLDEAFLDVTEPLRGPPSGTLLAQVIKEEIRDETGLTASAGVAASKFLAKVASARNKPDGLTVVSPGKAERFIAALPIQAFPGVGPRTEARMRELGIETGADLRAWPVEDLLRHFGKRGRHFHQLAHDCDRRSVEPTRKRKSVGAERTFRDDLTRVEDMREALETLARDVEDRMERAGARGRTVTLKLKDPNHQVRTRQTTLPRPVHRREALTSTARALLDADPGPPPAVRLLGISVAGLEAPDGPRTEQLVLSLPCLGQPSESADSTRASRTTSPGRSSSSTSHPDSSQPKAV